MDKDVFNFNGVCQRTWWRKKSVKELARLRDKTIGIQLAGEEPKSWEYRQQHDYETQ